ncbi:hypothetical protein NL676_036024 [Syzygium grande]|nr:hypothetical protein NL676_036024 [Syzygium grande]
MENNVIGFSCLDDGPDSWGGFAACSGRGAGWPDSAGADFGLESAGFHCGRIPTGARFGGRIPTGGRIA